VVAREWLDAAVSMYHLSENLNRIRLRQIVGHGVVMGDASAPSIGDTSCPLPPRTTRRALRVLAPHRDKSRACLSGTRSERYRVATHPAGSR
jgi:hypothetical protein